MTTRHGGLDMGVNEEKLAALEADPDQSGPGLGGRTSLSGSVSRLDRWFTRKLLDVVGDPPFAIQLRCGPDTPRDRES